MSSQFSITNLSNGATLITVPVAGTEAVTALALFPVGSRYEGKEESGLSHFIEHMMFKGTGKRPTTLDISKELDSVGAEYNAYTGRDHTGYYIKIAAEKVDLALDLLSDMIWNSKFAAEEINREKGVIVEEINMYQDNPTMYIEQLFEEAVYHGHPLGRDIAGRAETVKKIDREKILSHYRKFYQPRNLVLVVAGKIKKEIDVKKYFQIKSKGPLPPDFLRVKSLKNFPARPKLLFKQTDQVHLALGFPACSYDDPRFYPLTILNIILGGTMSSRLFTEVRERRGLAYIIQSGVNYYQETGNLMIRAGLDKNRLKEAFQVILAEIKKIKESGVTLEELKMAKENIAGHLVLSLEDSSAQAEWYGKQALLMKKIMTPAEKMKKFQAVGGNAVRKLAKEIFKFFKLRLAVIGPYREAGDVNDLLKIGKLW